MQEPDISIKITDHIPVEPEDSAIGRINQSVKTAVLIDKLYWDRIMKGFADLLEAFKPLIEQRTELWFCQDPNCSDFAEPGTPGWVDDLGGPFCGIHS